jgi:hypothetical protein
VQLSFTLFSLLPQLILSFSTFSELRSSRSSPLQPHPPPTMAVISSTEDRIRTEFATLLDNFSNLIRAAKLPDPASEAAAAPGELLEVFVEKVLAAAASLLGLAAELKRVAVLNDVGARNAEVRGAREAFEKAGEAHGTVPPP